MTTTSKFQMTAVARALLAAGLTAASHHMQIKAGYAKLTGHQHAEDGHSVQDLRDAMEVVAAAEAARAAKPAKTPGAVHLTTLAELPKGGKWGRVVRIVAWGRKGQPKRVVIRCGCGNEREIATQDLFQVRHCSLKCKRTAEQAAERGETTPGAAWEAVDKANAARRANAQRARHPRAKAA